MTMHGSSGREWRLFWRTWDAYIVLPVLALVLIGIATVYSATALTESGGTGLVLRHIVAILLGLGVAYLLAKLPPRGLDDYSPLLYGISVVLLALVLVAGESHFGARRWLSVGPLRLQPSEPAKLALIVLLAHFLAIRGRDLRRMGVLARALAIILVPALLVLKEPDLGTALAFPVVGGAMLIWAGLPWMTLWLLVSPVVTAVLSGLRFAEHTPALLGWLWVPFAALTALRLRARAVSWVLIGLFGLLHLMIALETPRIWSGLEPYQQARLRTFLHPERDPSGAGYQVIQSKIAIGSGCVAGQGFGRGSQKALSFLPRQHTDFIYSVVGEEFGFLGASLVLALYTIVLLRGVLLARKMRSPFGGLATVGVTTLLFYHMAVNAGMTLGLMPVTGLPLPFLSFGGSFLVTMMAAIGLLLGMAARRYER
jgi:rod shape determining protein RodA